MHLVKVCQYRRLSIAIDVNIASGRFGVFQVIKRSCGCVRVFCFEIVLLLLELVPHVVDDHNCHNSWPGVNEIFQNVGLLQENARIDNEIDLAIVRPHRILIQKVLVGCHRRGASRSRQWRHERMLRARQWLGEKHVRWPVHRRAHRLQTLLSYLREMCCFLFSQAFRLNKIRHLRMIFHLVCSKKNNI